VPGLKSEILTWQTQNQEEEPPRNTRNTRNLGAFVYFVYFVVALPAGQLAHVITISKQRHPTARSGVSMTATDSMDHYLFPTAAFRHAKNLCLRVSDPEAWTKLSLQ
jgi:hypothetical protein